MRGGLLDAALAALQLRGDIATWLALLKDVSPPLTGAAAFDGDFFERTLDVVANYLDDDDEE